jgi:hypothetical protein
MAELFIEGMTFEQFRADTKTVFAVIRALVIIGVEGQRWRGLDALFMSLLDHTTGKGRVPMATRQEATNATG